MGRVYQADENVHRQRPLAARGAARSPVVYARHLPPSAGSPRVLALDSQAAAELAGVAQVTLVPDPDDLPPGPFDAIAGLTPPERLEDLRGRLRPGGRLILASDDNPAALLAALTAAGLIHCLVEPDRPLNLYRGERQPEGSPLERLRALANEPLPSHQLAHYDLPVTNPAALTSPFVFLLVSQTPNKPAWKLAVGETVQWRAATMLLRPGEPPILLAFSSLVKAVACMQGAVLAGRLEGVNKVGKFPAAAAQGWPLPLTLNPVFEAIRDFAPGPPFEVDPLTAVTADE